MKITLEKGQQLFFTSDTHYSHSNICSATTNWTESSNLTRDFNSLDHMNDTLVNNINCMVGEDDILIHLEILALEDLTRYKNSEIELFVKTFT